MSTFYSAVARLLAPAILPNTAGPARQLMERAGARAGQDPRQARELRQAAQAWLRVVR